MADRGLGRAGIARMAAVTAGLALAGLAGGGALAGPQGRDCAGALLTVSADGMARVAPDMASISLGVSKQAPTAAAAMDQVSQAQAAVIAALKQAGLPEDDIQTSGLTLSPRLEYPEGQAPRVVGYGAQNMVTIRVQDLARLGAVLDGIVAAGANEVHGISFGRSDAGAAEDEARRAAVAEARHRAGVLAEAAGLTLGPVRAIRDVAPGGMGPQPMAMRAMAAEAVPVQAGTLDITASVEIDYALRGDAACGGPKGKQMPQQDKPSPQN